MLSRVAVPIVILAALLAGTRPARAGDELPSHVDRMLVQVERTRDMLELADGRVRRCGDPRAASQLRSAFELQERAEGAIRQSRRLAALQLTRGARERCLEALAVCRLDEGVPELAQRALERTERILSRGGSRGWEGPPPGRGRGRRFGDRARPPFAGPPPGTGGRALRLQEDAWREFHAGRYEASLRLTLAARVLGRPRPR